MGSDYLGLAIGASHNAGEAQRSAWDQYRRANDAEGALDIATDMISKLIPDAFAFRDWNEFIRDSDYDGGNAFTIFTAVRPDLVDKENMTAVRLANLKIIAWAEFFTMTESHGRSTAKKHGPELVRVSEALERDDINKPMMVNVLRDIAARMELTREIGYDIDPVEWVDKRVEELKRDADFESGATIPNPESVRVTDPALKQIKENRGGALDIMGDNFSHAQDLSISL